MASLVPAIGVYISKVTAGEKRLAYRLEQKLEDDWLLWYDVPFGPPNAHPDFVVFNPNKDDGTPPEVICRLCGQMLHLRHVSANSRILEKNYLS